MTHDSLETIHVRMFLTRRAASYSLVRARCTTAPANAINLYTTESKGRTTGPSAGNFKIWHAPSREAASRAMPLTSSFYESPFLRCLCPHV